MVTYEWDVEEIDEFEDIIEHHHGNRLAEVIEWLQEPNTRLVLVRDVGNDIEGITDRTWAYVEGGKLPDHFDYGGGEIGPKVPKRFHDELRKIWK